MKISNKVFVGTMAAVLAVSVGLTAGAATAHWEDASAKGGSGWGIWAGPASTSGSWASIRDNVEQVGLTPGTDNTQLNFAWYSKTSETPAVKISTSGDMSGAVTFNGRQTAATTVTSYYDATKTGQYYPSKVTVTGLKENTAYYYSNFQNGAWSAPVQYKTGSFSNISVMWVGDPQIGSSKKQFPSSYTDADGNKATLDPNGSGQNEDIAARNDAFNWNATIQTALNAHPGFNFILSAGDQTESTGTIGDLEWTGFLSPAALRSVPVATAIGNHDANGTALPNHYFTPNANTDESNAKAAGYDYYFSSGSALFIVLDTNNLNIADHKNTLDKAVAAYPNAKWRIVSSHQDLYGSGQDHSDSDGMILRTQLTPLFSQYKIDLVLNGHDHTYSRSKELLPDGKTHTAFSGTAQPADGSPKVSQAEYLAQNNDYSIVQNTNSDPNTVIDPKGTFYFSSDSATGSKYYELITPQQDYVAQRWQNWVPTYSMLNINSTSLTINTYTTDNGSKIDDTFTIVKSADKSSLNGLINEAKGVTQGQYTDDSYNAVQAALANAQKVAADAKSTETDISNAYSKLQQALVGLTLRSVTPTNTSVSGSTDAADSPASNPDTGDTGANMYLQLAAFGALAVAAVAATRKIKRRFGK